MMIGLPLRDRLRIAGNSSGTGNAFRQAIRQPDGRTRGIVAIRQAVAAACAGRDSIRKRCRTIVGSCGPHVRLHDVSLPSRTGENNVPADLGPNSGVKQLEPVVQ